MPITNGRYVNPGWVNGQPPAINASELNAVSDTLERLTAPGGRRGGYVVVGTSTEGATAFDCDFLCDGTADDVEINAAIQEAQSMNLGVFLLPGTYNIANTITIYGEFCGASNSNTTLNRTSVSFDYLVKMGNNSYLHDIAIYGSFPPETSTSCIEIYALADASIKNVFINGYTNIGIANASDASTPGGGYGHVILDGVSTFAAFQGQYSILLSKLANYVGSAFIRNCSFDTTAKIQACGTNVAGVPISGSSFDTLSIENCLHCSIFGNNILVVLSVSRAGTSTFSCESNIISNNSFSEGSGITLGVGTTNNLVTGNGGGMSSVPWAGVTDNGSNNYVANNMPTS